MKFENLQNEFLTKRYKINVNFQQFDKYNLFVLFNKYDRHFNYHEFHKCLFLQNTKNIHYFKFKLTNAIFFTNFLWNVVFRIYNVVLYMNIYFCYIWK